MSDKDWANKKQPKKVKLMEIEVVATEPKKIVPYCTPSESVKIYSVPKLGKNE